MDIGFPIDTAIQLQRNRKSVAEIARLTGTNSWRVSRELFLAGYDPIEEHRDELIRLFDDGETLSICLSSCGISTTLKNKARLIALLEEAGVDTQETRVRKFTLNGADRRGGESQEPSGVSGISEAEATRQFLAEWNNRNTVRLPPRPSAQGNREKK